MALMLASMTPTTPSSYLESSERAANWIRRESKQAGQSLDLYSGTPGAALFFCECYNSTKKSIYLEDAIRIGDKLIAGAPEVKDCGFYTGLAGISFTLNELAKFSRDHRFSKAADAIYQRIATEAKPTAKGIDWSGGNDIISGSAGIGCFLLYAASEMKEVGALDLARKVGDQLLEVAITEGRGMKWKMADDSGFLMPNFSHGTAGIAFFLGRLYEETKDSRYLAGAKAGATYLMSETSPVGLIRHDDKGGKELYYLGWCHGPVGTSRLFGLLHRITHENLYADWIDRAAATLLKSGIPERETPGFWNNVGQCCGSAGVGEFFLSIYQFDELPAEIAFARRLTDDLLKRATKDGDGIKWIQAENRTQPKALKAQIGLMQGAAGIGLWLLHLDAQDRGLKPVIYLPDNPFRGRHS